MGDADPSSAPSRRRTAVARHPHVLAVTVAALVVVGVVSAPWALSQAGAESTAQGRWALVAGTHGVSPGMVIDVHGGEITGRAPCNDFRATWSAQTGPSELLSAAALCRDPNTNDTEATYYSLLNGTGSVEVTETGLRLVGPRGTLTFRRLR